MIWNHISLLILSFETQLICYELGEIYLTIQYNLQAYASCDNTVLEVPTKHDGEYNVKVLVHSPKVSKCN